MEKYEINANKAQLERLGISYDISGLIGVLKFKYPTGWHHLEVEHEIGEYKFTNSFDLPKSFLKKM
jgi:hypothetical protein